MNRIGFMTQLAALLQDVPVEERREAMQYYNDYFDDCLLYTSPGYRHHDRRNDGVVFLPAGRALRQARGFFPESMWSILQDVYKRQV